MTSQDKAILRQAEYLRDIDVLDKPWPRWQRWAFRAVLAAVVIVLGVVIVSEYRAAVLTPGQVHAMKGGLR